MSSRLRPSLRRAAGLVLGLFVAAWGLDVHHRTWVAHELCELHGELTHGAHGHGPDQGAHQEDDAGPRLSAPAGGDGAHEHCGLPDLERAGGLDLGAALRPVAPPPALALRVEPGAPTHEAVARLHLAPKQSPPDAA